MSGKNEREMRLRKSNPRDLGDEMYKEKYNVGIKKIKVDGKRRKARHSKQKRRPSVVHTELSVSGTT